MKTLSTEHRRQLERTVVEARDIAEAGARGALEALAVHHHEPYGHMSGEQRKLRNRLRAHARHLGDRVDARSGAHAIDHLVHECAYEHWHGMLFARFLAENHLLIEPEMGVAITLDECEELAKEEGVDKWVLAARFAHRMLPQVFRPDHPVFEVQFAREHRLKLEALVEGLPVEVFIATDALGWVYQFWQTKKKDEVNRSEVKIGADELPAVTQLFTEPYMVQFLLHNSLGAWWVSRHSDKACPVELTYLRTSPPNPLSLSGEGELASPSQKAPPDSLSLTGEGEWRERAGEREWHRRPPVVTGNRVAPEKLELARKYRKEPTPEEAQVWEWLRNRRMLGLKFRRQQIIEGFIADFYCAERRIALELDGASHNTPAAGAYDEARDAVFAGKGIHVLRIRNNECSLSNIERKLKSLLSSPSSSSFSPSPFMERGPGGEVPVAGAFEGWPDDLSEFRLLDPCCGSGHFLVAAFLMLVPMRMALEELNAADAVDAVLRDNLHGLELDQRCVAIAAFSLALEAWRYPDAGGFRTLPKLNLAWCGQPVAGKREQWLVLAEGDSRLEAGMAALYDTFRDAPTLGSLIDPPRSVSEDLLTAGFEELQPLLEKALREHAGEEEWEETAIAALGLAEATRLLSGHYHLVITNVPYLTRGKQSDRLRKFADTRYPKAKNDLANVFLERCLEFSKLGGAGVTQIVMPQNWLFLASYKTHREHLLRVARWELLARLGEGGFDSTQAAGAFIILLTISRIPPHIEHFMHGIDASAPRTAVGKSELLKNGALLNVSQRDQFDNPDARISLTKLDSLNRLEEYADSFLGLGTGDFDRFGRRIWEFDRKGENWSYLQSAPQRDGIFDGLSLLVAWDHSENRVYGMDQAQRERIHNQDQSGQQAWGRMGIGVALMRGLRTSGFLGSRYDKSMAAIVPKNEDHAGSIFAFCNSPEFHERVREIDQNIIVANGTLVKVPFDLEYWTKIAAERYPNGLPKPRSSDPTQWVFHGNPCSAESPLQVVVARLLGYRWPAENDAYMELADDQRALIEKNKLLYRLEDEDGIVCIPSVRGERPAAERLLELLHAAYGDDWHDANLTKLLAESSSASLDDWLRNQFFDEHCKLFQHRPFIWHIWDGRKRDGFHALVNYHKLAEGDGKGRRLLESLTYSYLGDWITRQQDGVKRGEGGAEDRLAAALELQKRLVSILEGESPFDVFVRWKPIEEQPIGWDPDINDGVRLNIRPFMAQDLPGGKKGAGILRAKPNIHWKKDRGKEPTRDEAQFPWFWKNGKFAGERVNDVHLTNAEKRAARQRMQGEAKGGRQ